MKITSAEASKMLRDLDAEKAYLLSVEEEAQVYFAEPGEKPEKPEYDYAKVAKAIEELDAKMARIKHAINMANTSAQIPIGDEILSVDSILIEMTQLNARKRILDTMRKRLPKMRVENRNFRSVEVVYQYVNYDLDLIRNEFTRVSNRINMLQLALDKYNQVVDFEVDI